MLTIKLLILLLIIVITMTNLFKQQINKLAKSSKLLSPQQAETYCSIMPLRGADFSKSKNL